MKEFTKKLWDKQILKSGLKHKEFLIEKWEPTGLLNKVRNRGEIATHLENCAIYLVQYEHGDEIGSQMIAAIRLIYDMDNDIEFHFEILADEFYDRLIKNPLFGESYSPLDAEIEIALFISENYAKNYASKERFARIKKLFYDLDREKGWIERENLIINYITCKGVIL